MTVLKNDFGTSWVNQPGRNESFFDALGFTNAGNGHKVVDVAHTFLRGADSSCFILNGPVAIPHPPVIAGVPRHLVRRRNGDLILSILVVFVWRAAHAVPVLTSRATAPTGARSLAPRELSFVASLVVSVPSSVCHPCGVRLLRSEY